VSCFVPRRGRGKARSAVFASEGPGHTFLLLAPRFPDMDAREKHGHDEEGDFRTHTRNLQSDQTRRPPPPWPARPQGCGCDRSDAKASTRPPRSCAQQASFRRCCVNFDFVPFIGVDPTIV